MAEIEHSQQCTIAGCICSMTREQAVKHIAARSKMLVHRIKAMPRSEQIRFAADLFDHGMSNYALSTLRYVVSELEKDAAHG